ncbi:outer membrane transport energization protein ExbB [Pontibacter ummariensis]|uniref:Outer membrane transport energization protein ExbB n=1 Tax=Pontibacter ummariensis TaxID=1610492 RepID=A0A239BZP7_9BACT|nr:MotA/TolQ/ExbB proton channel family protein [Pontibacter ummariensis]PRY15550.1 outer membrane transport energization protein ExbB [Pontibacter ummariensis]SNS12888.1 outer membrane transport energization protein ExbB [Pontibacter ummariensis]
MTSLLLQITTSAPADTAAALVEGAEAASESVSLIDLAMAGGWAMIPLLLLSLAAVYIFVERYLTLKKAAKNPEGFNDRIKSMVLAGDINGAKLLCSQTNTPVSRMLEKGLNRIGNPLKNIETSIENVGKIEISRLEKNLSALATIAGAAPMLGFLGTVTGMIGAFIAIAQAEGSVSPKLLSSGIYEAMVTTATGLIIGLPAYVGYNYLVSKIDNIVHAMEYSSIEFLDLLQEPQL